MVAGRPERCRLKLAVSIAARTAYRAEKLARLRKAHIDSVILFSDDDHPSLRTSCSLARRIVRYRRRIRPEAVLDVLEG